MVRTPADYSRKPRSPPRENQRQVASVALIRPPLHLGYHGSIRPAFDVLSVEFASAAE